MVTLETYGKGYGGDVGLMVGIDLEKEQIYGVGVTTHAETPGMGALAKTEGYQKFMEDLPLREGASLNHEDYEVKRSVATTLAIVSKQDLSIGNKLVELAHHTDDLYLMAACTQALILGEWVNNEDVSNLFGYKQSQSTSRFLSAIEWIERSGKGIASKYQLSEEYK